MCWRPLESVPLREVGFELEDAMVPQRANMHPSWRLLTEYFACAEKFNFVDIDLTAIAEQLPRTVMCDAISSPITAARRRHGLAAEPSYISNSTKRSVNAGSWLTLPLVW
jgi:type VI secretion system protein ImpG